MVFRRPKVVDLSPRPASILESLRSIGYSLETALADIVDNSLSAEAKQIDVEFRWNEGNPWIAVIDNGHGMSAEDLLEGMRFGSMSPREARAASDLGRFGLGMKTASISQSRHLTVISKKKGSIHACEWDIDEITGQDSTEWGAHFLLADDIGSDSFLDGLVQRHLQQTPAGTIVLWRNLDPLLGNSQFSSGENGFSEAMAIARKHLEMVFHRFLSPGRRKAPVVIRFNGSRLESFDPFGPPALARQELTSLSIPIHGHTVQVQAYVLPHHSKLSRAEYQRYGGAEGYLENQGFYLYRNRRLIIKGTWFRMIRKEELNKLIRVRVDIPNTLDHLWKLDVKKSQADPPEAVRRELRKVIEKIAGAGRRVFTKRATNVATRHNIPVWRRQIKSGQVSYMVNEDHPLISRLLGELGDEQKRSFRTCLKLIGASFPTDLHFADAANDELEWAPAVTESESREIIFQLIQALRDAGFAGDALKQQLLKIETVKLSPDLVEQLISEECTAHG